MFIYVNTAALEREEVVVFLNFYLDTATTLVEEVGYVSLPETMYDDGRALVTSSAGSSN
jgi:phosphate transport system substrate-binding protein